MFKPLQNGIFVFIVSIIYSLIEIEMEGKHGWCKNLPTAKKVVSSFTLYPVSYTHLTLPTKA